MFQKACNNLFIDSKAFDLLINFSFRAFDALPATLRAGERKGAVILSITGKEIKSMYSHIKAEALKKSLGVDLTRELFCFIEGTSILVNVTAITSK